MRILPLLVLLAACETTIEDPDDTGGGGENDTDDTEDTDDTGDTTPPLPARPDDDTYVVVPGEDLTVLAADGLLSNDADVVAFVSADESTDQGVPITATSDGGFSYAAPRSMRGADSFSYRVVGADGVEVSATVQLEPRPGCGDGAIKPGELCFDLISLPAPGPRGQLVTGDLNNDDIPDAIMSGANGYVSTRFQVLLGDGTSLLPASELTVLSGGAGGMALADLDGDGDLDLITATMNGLETLQNDGSGTFSEWTQLGWQRFGETYTLDVGDLDGDGNIDVALGDEYGYLVALYLGDGAGGLSQAGQDTYTNLGPVRIYLLDLIGSDALDVAVLGSYAYESQLDLLENDGTGTLTTTSLALPNPPGRDLALADLDGSSGPDLIIPTGANGTIDTLTVLPGDSTGGFGTAVDITPATGLAGVSHLEVADLDGDGHLDIITIDGQGRLNIAWGTGTHSPATETWRSAPQQAAAALDLADLDADGRPEVLLLTEQNLRILRVDTARSVAFDDTRVSSVPTGDFITTIASGDLNGDGAPDLVGADYNAGTLVWLTNDGFGGLPSAQTLSTVGSGAHGVTLADLDSDGDLDLLSANTQTSTVSVRMNAPGVALTSAADVAVGPGASRVLAIDVNSDDILDLVTANVGSFAQVYTDPQDTISIRLGVGDGTFTVPTVPEVDVCPGPERLDAGLINTDEHLDLLVTCLGSPSATVLLGDGAGSFTPTNTSLFAEARQANLADLNGDGFLDFVQTGSTGGELRVYLGDGTGAFTSGTVLAPGGFRYGLALADLDGDSHIDIISPSYSGVAVYLGVGDGTFPDTPSALLQGTGTEVSVVDLDNDGDLDIVVASRSSVTPLLNRR